MCKIKQRTQRAWTYDGQCRLFLGHDSRMPIFTPILSLSLSLSPPPSDCLFVCLCVVCLSACQSVYHLALSELCTLPLSLSSSLTHTYKHTLIRTHTSSQAHTYKRTHTHSLPSVDFQLSSSLFDLGSIQNA